MALFSVSIALLLWHLDALTIPLFEYRSSVFPLDVVVVECPRVAGTRSRLRAPAGRGCSGSWTRRRRRGARGVLCECHARGRATGDVQRVRAVAVGRFLVEALRPAGHPGRLAVGDVGAVVDAAPEDDEVLREAGHDLLARRGAVAADEPKAHLAYETVATRRAGPARRPTAQAAVLSAAAAARRTAVCAPLRARRARGGRVAPSTRVRRRRRLRGVRAGQGAYARGGNAAARTGRSATTSRNSRRRGEGVQLRALPALAPDPARPLAVCSRRGPRARGCGADARLRSDGGLARAARRPRGCGACRADPLADTAPAAADSVLPAAVARAVPPPGGRGPHPPPIDAVSPPLPAGLRLINTTPRRDLRRLPLVAVRERRGGFDPSSTIVRRPRTRRADTTPGRGWFLMAAKHGADNSPVTRTRQGPPRS